eukprot:3417823-Pyramimonas_sp.AAC.1
MLGGSILDHSGGSYFELSWGRVGVCARWCGCGVLRVVRDECLSWRGCGHVGAVCCGVGAWCGAMRVFDSVSNVSLGRFVSVGEVIWIDAALSLCVMGALALVCPRRRKAAGWGPLLGLSGAPWAHLGTSR